MRRFTPIAVAMLGAFLMAMPAPAAVSPSGAEDRFAAILHRSAPFSLVPDELFAELGWNLPDGGLEVKRLAHQAPGGTLDPRDVAYLPMKVGYRAKWHVVRFTYYGLPWDVTGVYLEPYDRDPGLPTLVLIAGAGSNWYTFFLDPNNNPGLAQHLAQRMPVLLVTIPGSYQHGGWSQAPEKRKPAYDFGRELGNEEVRARNVMLTFRLITEGIVRLLDQATQGPLLFAGQGTCADVPFLLMDRIGTRARGLFLSWASGGPASITRMWAPGKRTGEAPSELRPLSAESIVPFVGPLHPLLRETTRDMAQWRSRLEADPDLPLKTARSYVAAESYRQPFFQTGLHVLESRGNTAEREEIARALHSVAVRTGFPPRPNEVVSDLFANVRAPLTGYRRMVWLVGSQDADLWDTDPEKAQVLFAADAFRERNPEAELRVLVFETPLTALGHIEMPRALAGALHQAIQWLSEPESQ